MVIFAALPVPRGLQAINSKSKSEDVAWFDRESLGSVIRRRRKHSTGLRERPSFFFPLVFLS